MSAESKKVDLEELRRLYAARDAFKIMALIPAILAERSAAQNLAADFQTIAENVKLAWRRDTAVGWGWLADEVAKRCAEEVAKGRATPQGYALVRVEQVKDAERYAWLRDVSVPPHNFYLSVPAEFAGVRYKPQEVDDYIDKAMLTAAAAAKGE